MPLIFSNIKIDTTVRAVINVYTMTTGKTHLSVFYDTWWNLDGMKWSSNNAPSRLADGDGVSVFVPELFAMGL